MSRALHRSTLFLLFTTVILACASNRRSAPANPTPTDGGAGSIHHEGRERSYLVRVPEDIARAGKQVPLVIMLHGGGGNADNAERMSDFTTLARREGFIVVYPEGTARGRAGLRTWNAVHCCSYAMTEQVDDIGFIAKLIDHLAAQYPIDPSRVYVTGMSNGGLMSHRLGRELSHRIAAIAPVVGAVFGDEPPPASPVAVLIINGVLDKAVPWEGGHSDGRFGARAWDGTPMQPAMAQGRYWASANRCGTTSSVSRHSGYNRHYWDCPDNTAVELYEMTEMGHAWPGGMRGTPGADDPGNAFSASEVIWQFFKSHSRR